MFPAPLQLQMACDPALDKWLQVCKRTGEYSSPKEKEAREPTAFPSHPIFWMLSCENMMLGAVAASLQL